MFKATTWWFLQNGDRVLMYVEIYCLNKMATYKKTVHLGMTVIRESKTMMKATWRSGHRWRTDSHGMTTAREAYGSSGVKPTVLPLFPYECKSWVNKIVSHYIIIFATDNPIILQAKWVSEGMVVWAPNISNKHFWIICLRRIKRDYKHNGN